MNTLYLVHRIPYPPDRGDRIRSYHLLRYLAARGQVDLACLADEAVTSDVQVSLERLCRRVFVARLGRTGRWLHAAYSLAGGRSASEGLFFSRELINKVAAWSRDTRYDCVVAFCSSMRRYIELSELDGAQRVVDLVDVDSQKWFDYARHGRGWKQQLFQLEGRRVRRLEADLARKAELLLTVSEPEAALLRQIAPHANVRAVANGVNLDYFSPRHDANVRPFSCVFVGALDYRANVEGITWFCHHVWPLIITKCPHATLAVVGRNPVPAVRRLARISGVDVVGQVRDVRPHVAQAALAVVPLRVARGIQNKVLEAAAMGKAIVCSSEALEGLDLKPDQHLLRADTPDEWIAAILRLFQAPDDASRFGAAARAFVESRHRWSDRLSMLDHLLRSSALPCRTLAGHAATT